jgi:hypothetical protein
LISALIDLRENRINTFVEISHSIIRMGSYCFNKMLNRTS